MKNFKSFDQFVNEIYNVDEMSSFPGRAWENKLNNIDNLFTWMYSKGIMNKGEQQEKDIIFRRYYRYYNDGDTPNIPTDGVESIEHALERNLEDFMKSILAKYAGKYDRRKFHFDTLLSELYGLQNNIKFMPDTRDKSQEVFDYDVHSFMYFYKKLGKVNHPEFDKLVTDLDKAWKKWQSTADKQIEDKLKENPDLGGFTGTPGGGLSTNKIVMSKKVDMEAAGIWTDTNQKELDVLTNISDRLYEIIGNVIEAVNKAKAQLNESVNEASWDDYVGKWGIFVTKDGDPKRGPFGYGKVTGPPYKTEQEALKASKKIKGKDIVSIDIKKITESVNEFGPLSGSGNKDELEKWKRKASKKSERGQMVYIIGATRHGDKSGLYQLSKYEEEGNTYAAYYNGMEQDIDESVNEELTDHDITKDIGGKKIKNVHYDMGRWYIVLDNGKYVMFDTGYTSPNIGKAVDLKRILGESLNEEKIMSKSEIKKILKTLGGENEDDDAAYDIAQGLIWDTPGLGNGIRKHYNVADVVGWLSDHV